MTKLWAIILYIALLVAAICLSYIQYEDFSVIGYNSILPYINNRKFYVKNIKKYNAINWHRRFPYLVNVRYYPYFRPFTY